MGKTITTYLLVAIAVICVTYGYYKINAQGNSSDVICDQPYALCTSAPCIPDPTDPTKSLCFCEVLHGKSLGQEACSKRKLHADARGVQYLSSTYSFAQYPTKKTMFCPDGTPWSFCLDMPCTIDPENPKKAICSCDVYTSGRFLTLGGDCDTTTCSGSYWSGATLDQTRGAMAVLAKALGMKKGPENYCNDTQ